MDSPYLSQLESLHLPTNEASVFLVLLEIGQTSAGEIIKRTGLHRSVVYESLDRLIQRKLAFKLEKNNISHFQATDPDRLLQQAKAQVDIAQQLIPNLKELAKSKSPEITVYEGITAYRRFWIENVMNMPEGSTDYVAGSITEKWQEMMGKDMQRYIDIHIQRRIKWKMIVFEREQLEFQLRDKYPELHEYRYINRQFAKDGNFNVLGTESILLHTTVEPMIIEVKSPTLVSVFQNLFDILWEMGEEG